MPFISEPPFMFPPPFDNGGPKPGFSAVRRVLAWMGGLSARSLQRVPPQEFDDFVMRGLMALASFFAASIGFTVIGRTLYGEAFSPVVIAGAAILAACSVTIIDITFFYRLPLHQLGADELARGGLRQPRKRGFASKLATGLRIGQACVTGAVVGLFMSLLAYNSDIAALIQADYLADNKAIAEQFAATYDAAIKRATVEVEEEAATQRELDRQIGALQQNETRAALRANRKGAPPAQATAQLAGLSAKRTSGSAMLESRKTELATMVSQRNVNVLHAIDTAPNAKPKRDGILGRLSAFGSILDANKQLLAIVAAIEGIAISLELAPCLAHFVWTPSSFAAQLALDNLKAVTSLAREGALFVQNAAPIRLRAAEAPPADEPVPPAEPTSPTPPTEPPRRGRGRPPKSPPNGYAPQSPQILPPERKSS